METKRVTQLKSWDLARPSQEAGKGLSAEKPQYFSMIRKHYGSGGKEKYKA